MGVLEWIGILGRFGNRIRSTGASMDKNSSTPLPSASADPFPSGSNWKRHRWARRGFGGMSVSRAGRFGNGFYSFPYA